MKVKIQKRRYDFVVDQSVSLQPTPVWICVFVLSLLSFNDVLAQYCRNYSFQWNQSMKFSFLSLPIFYLTAIQIHLNFHMIKCLLKKPFILYYMYCQLSCSLTSGARVRRLARLKSKLCCFSFSGYLSFIPRQLK